VKKFFTEPSCFKVKFGLTEKLKQTSGNPNGNAGVKTERAGAASGARRCCER